MFLNYLLDIDERIKLTELLISYQCREAIGRILARGHSRIPVYSGNTNNIIGLLLVSMNPIHQFQQVYSGQLADHLIVLYFSLFWGRQVKNLLTVRAETETPVSAVSIRRIPRCVSLPLHFFILTFSKAFM